jgi:outer membrane protein insertion porin family
MKWILRGLCCCGVALALMAGGRTLWADSPVGKIVNEVIIQGNQLRSREDVLSQMQTRPGKEFSRVTSEDDVRRLTAKGWFTGDGVRIETRERPDGKVDVIVQVRELTSVVNEIVYRGAQHMSPDELNKLTGLRRGTPMSPVANRAAVQAILRKYYDDGRLWAQVRLVEGDKTEDTRVVFDIVEGPRAKVAGIDFKFVGERSGEVSIGRLRTQINTSKAFLTVIGGDYDPTKVDFDVLRLQDYYKALGFLRVRVGRDLTWSSDMHTVTVVFHIEEGPRYQVDHVQIDGNKVYDEQALLKLTDLRPGQPYQKKTIQADTSRIRDYYGFGGRQVPVNERIVEEDGAAKVSIHYQIEERPPTRVADVIVQGNEVTRDNVIRRQVPLYPGQILTYPDLLQAEMNLRRLGIFEEDPAAGGPPTVTVDNPDVDEPFKTVRVNVHEKPTGSFMVGVGINSDAGLTGSIVLNERNFDILNPPSSIEELLSGRAWRGAGQDFRLEAVPGTQFQRYTASWREPFLFDSPYSLGLSAYYYTRNFLEYDESRVGGRITLGRKLNQFWSVNGTMRIESVDVFNVQPYEPLEIQRDSGSHFQLGTRLGFTRDTRDSYLRPTTGSLLDFGAEEVFGDFTFPLLTMEGTKFWTVGERPDGSGKQVLALHSHVSYAGSNTPVYERFYAGGFRSIRGFSFRGVGPHVLDFNVGGDFAWLNSLEYQIPLMASDNLFFVAFLDSGTVERSVEIRDYRVTAGAGLRIAVPQLLGPVPIALDFGYPLTQAPGDKRQIFSFWLGFFN